MAVTYDLEIDQIGVVINRITGLTTTDYTATSLIPESSYRIRARYIDTTSGVSAYSPWTAWVNFSTVAEATDITSLLGLITNTKTIYAITTEVEIPVIVTTTYDIKLTKTGQTPVLITGISLTEEQLTGLDASTSYAVSVRQVVDVNGLVMYSPWSAVSNFNTTAAATNVDSPLGSITSTQTVNSISTVISEPETIVSAYELDVLQVGGSSSRILGISGNSYTLTGLTTGEDYQVKARQAVSVNGVFLYSAWSSPASFTAVADGPQPIVSIVGNISNAQTVNGITTVIGAPTVEVAADHWLVTVTNTDTATIEQEFLIFESQINLIDLLGITNYQVDVVGIKNGTASEPAIITFQTEALTVYASTVYSAEQPLDVFSFTLNSLYNRDMEVLKLFGIATGDLLSVSGTINGNGFAGQVDQHLWEAYYTEGNVELLLMDELDGLATIQINPQNDILELN